MRILIGIDTAGHYRSALTLAARLRFEEAKMTLLAVDEKASFPIALPNTPLFTGRDAMHLDPKGQTALDQAGKEAISLGIHADAMYEAGDVAEELRLQASQLPADLIAIGSREHGLFSAFTLGSVGRALAQSAEHSFMVSHGTVSPAGDVRAVFATDLSPYAGLAVRSFLQWAPQGLSHVTVLHALEVQGGSPVEEDEQIAQAVRHVEETAREFRDAGIPATASIHAGNPAEVIEATIKAADADLLVMAARGHGFIQQAVLGSHSMHQVVSGKHPVLILRT